jgi:hypothetical protein
MARHFRINDIRRTRLTEGNGDEVDASEYRREFHPISDEEAEIVGSAEQRVGEDGNVYYVGISPEVMRLAVCQLCRHPRRRFLIFRRARRTGVFDAKLLNHCTDCRIPLCPRHTVLTAADGRPRCHRCDARYNRRQLVRCAGRFIFFEKRP